MTALYVLFDKKNKRYISTASFYGNNISILGFESKEQAQAHVDMYYKDREFIIKKMKV